MSSIFEPLGILTPAILLQAKLIIRDMGKNVDWDDCIPNDLFKRWKAWVEGLLRTKNVGIPQSICLNEKEDSKIEQIEFSDTLISNRCCSLYRIKKN